MSPSISRSVSSSSCLVLASASSRPSHCCLLLRKKSFVWEGKERINSDAVRYFAVMFSAKWKRYIYRPIHVNGRDQGIAYDGRLKTRGRKHGDNTSCLIVRSRPFIPMIQRLRRAPVL
ncbi:hypothetical protein B296_00039211 [Ensete ventricosum]|uniref:Uncharacterized protein n=1 Tax=Ensete ventricosum TaxID=4639 RepID=A0A426Y4L9_ENSVE|nr:hypothetical protein B296_00039211 [Ensete ventricosum]